MANNKIQKTKSEKEDVQKLSDERIKQLIQMLDIKRDTNMTRVYAAIQPLK